MCISPVFLCTVLLLVLCFLTCLWFCVDVTFCFMFYVFFVLCAALCFLTFFFCVAFVCTTPGSNSLYKSYPRLVLSHTCAGECGVCHSGIHKLHTGIFKKKKEKKMKWPDAASSACLMEVGSINLLFGQGLVCTCAGHTNWDVPLSALGLDVRPVLVGCSPLVWTLTSDIFWFHSMTSMSRGLISYLISVQRFVISEDWAAPQGLLQVVCVCEIQRRRETLMCVCVSHSNSVFLVYLHVSWAGQAL